MLRFTPSFAAAALAATVISGAAFSQGTTSMTAPQILPAMNIDLRTLSSGFRATQVVGRTVVNEINDTVGTIDDLIFIPSDSQPYAVLSVGGFLGMGSRHVVMPYNSLEEHGKQLLLRNVTQRTLQDLPEFKYAN